MIQLFLNRKQLPIYPVKNGEGWLLIEHQSVEELQLMITPEGAAMITHAGKRLGNMLT
ncbi:hypothetical protein MKY42_19755 [Paenibacillus sp. FSL W7-1088]|uniref:hypothetical protein n=1 Tax=unclassified Paenibacillus TaxID=185978 RepID=UPI00211C50D2|nr:hypothetical protein [Paenibacillus sp. E222]